MQRSAIYLCILLIVVFVTGAFTSLKFPSPVTRTGLTNIGVAKVDSSLVIYGINSAQHSFEAEMYNSQLQEVRHCKEIIKGFAGCDLKLQYQDDQKLEFVLTNKQNQKQKFIYLDQKLDSVYQSDWSLKPVLLIPVQIHIIDQFRSNQHYWEIRTESSTDKTGKSIKLTYLYQNDISLTTAGPINVLKKTYLLDSTIVEAARVMLERDNKVYVYINESTMIGKQYALCIDVAGGQLLYKTELTVTYDDINWPDNNHLKLLPHAQACIYSNSCWDDRTNRLMIAGTWLVDSLRRTGVFLALLDQSGNITGSETDYGVWLTNYVKYNSGTGLFGIAAIEQAYYRVVKMTYLPNGTFAVFSEVYGRKLVSPNGTGKDLTYTDDFHHFFCPEVDLFSVTATNVASNTNQTVVKETKWDVNHRLDSIAGYINGSTMLDDERFGTDPNVICDNRRQDYYFCDASSDEKSRMKVLMQDTVCVTPGKKTNDYFFRTLSYPVSSNCLAFTAAIPLHQQNYAEHNDYYAIDFSRLYRLHLTNDSYTLSIISW